MDFGLHLLNFPFVLEWVGMGTTLGDPLCARQRAGEQQLSQEGAAGRFALQHQQVTCLFRPSGINKQELLLLPLHVGAGGEKRRVYKLVPTL